MGGIPVTVVDKNGQPVTVVGANGGAVDWSEFVTSVNGKNGPEVTLVPSDIGALSASGGDISGGVTIADPTDSNKLAVGKQVAEVSNAPLDFDKSAIYLQLGLGEYGASSYRLIGFGWRKHETENHAPAVMGYRELSGSGSTHGRLIFATRDTNSDVAPEVRLTIDANGDIFVPSSYSPATGDSLVPRQYVDDRLSAAQRTAIDALDAGTATVADVVNALKATS